MSSSIESYDVIIHSSIKTVNLRHGVPKRWRVDNCVAGIGTLTLEFGLLSRLTGDPVRDRNKSTHQIMCILTPSQFRIYPDHRLTRLQVFEGVSRRALKALWESRDPTTDLLGGSIDVASGDHDCMLQ